MNPTVSDDAHTWPPSVYRRARILRRSSLLALAAASGLVLTGAVAAGGLSSGDIETTAARPAQAGPPPGLRHEYLLSTARYHDERPQIAYNPLSREFLVVWDHQGKIYGQRYTVAGWPMGDVFEVFGARYGGYQSAVAYSPRSNSYLVVWQDNGGEGDQDIRGQFVSALGELIDIRSTPEDESNPASAFTVYEGPGDQIDPELAFDGSSYLVVWSGNRTDDSTDVSGRFVHDEGTVDEGVLPLGHVGTAKYERPAIAFNESTNHYVVVFEYDQNGEAEIRGRRVHTSGNLPGAEFTVSDEPRCSEPYVTSGRGAEVLITWSAQPGASTSLDVYGRLVLADSDDADTGHDLNISESTGHAREATASLTAMGQFLIVWKDSRNYMSSGNDVYGRLLGHDCTPVWGAYAVAVEQGEQSNPAVAIDTTAGVALVAWQNIAIDGIDVHGQRLSVTGSPLGWPFAISADPGAQGIPAVAHNGVDGQFMAVWGDEDDQAIYALRMNADGEPAEEPWPIVEGSRYYDPTVAYSTAKGNYLVVFRNDETATIQARIVYPAGDTVESAHMSVSNAQRPRMAYDDESDTFLVVSQSEGDIDGALVSGIGAPRRNGHVSISAEDGNQTNPAVAHDYDHRAFLVVWEDKQHDQPRNVHGQLVQPDGSLVGERLCIAGCKDDIDHSSPSVAYNPHNHEFLVVYEDRDAGRDSYVRARRLSPSGEKLGSEIDISTEAGPVGQTPAMPLVAYLPTHQSYFVVWTRDEDDPTSYDLIGRWHTGGSAQTFPERFFVRAPGRQLAPSIARDPAGGTVLVAWTDHRRHGGSDVYAKLEEPDTTPPTARFIRRPSTGPVGTTFTFDARPSSDDKTPRGALSVRWDWTSDGNWDTNWAYEKVLTRTIRIPGIYTITLQVRDLATLTDQATESVTVIDATTDEPPIAALTVDEESGLAGRAFRYDASGSTDNETAGADLQFRWDWEDDGAYDTDWGRDQTVTREYTKAGEKTVRVEVMDESGLTDSAAVTVVVQPSNVARLEVTPTSVILVPGRSQVFRALAWDSYGNEIPKPGVIWAVSDAAAGSIEVNGTFTAGTQAGSYPEVVGATCERLVARAGVVVRWPFQVYVPNSVRE